MSKLNETNGSTTKSSRGRKTRIAVIGGAFASVLGVAAFLVLGSSASSANLSSQTQVGAQGGVGTLKLVANQGVNFSNMGVSTAETPRVYSQTVTFTNNGSLNGDKLTVGVPVNVNDFTVPAGQNPDWSQVRVTIPGTSVNDTPVTSLGSTVNLGSLNAGASKSVTFKVEIKSAGNNDAGDAKDNQFQGVNAGGSVTAKLRMS